MNKLFPVSVLIIILFTIFFLHLGRMPIRIWDESRYAFNAYEMAENGNLIIPYYEGKPDTWNMKPPFPIWCMTLCIKIMGPTETAIRLPSAIFGFLTSMLLFIFFWKYYDRFWLGFISAFMLSITPGYIEEHGARTGDTDIIHVFFLVFYTLLFWLYFERRKIKYLYMAMAAVAFAVLTKGIAGLFALPLVLAAAIHFKAIRPLLTDKRFYISLFVFLIMTAGYYLLRESYQPGYLSKVMEYEVTGRYLTTLEGHDEDFWFYYDELVKQRLPYWIAILPCGIACGIFANESRIRKVMTYIISTLLFLFLLLTFAHTKTFWYSYMLVPFCVILISYFIWIVFKFLTELDVKKYMRYNALGFAFLFLIFMTPYRSMLARTYMAEEWSWNVSFYSMGYYLQDVLHEKIHVDAPLKIVFTPKRIRPHLEYYIRLLAKKKIPVTAADVTDLNKGDNIACSAEYDLQYINDHFIVENVRTEKHVTFMHIVDIKN
jgi:4-amino-4-deoxy-L-arabinose transferase-like glycosyltransferase